MTPDRITTYLETGTWDPDWGPLPDDLAALRRELADPGVWTPPPADGADRLLAEIGAATADGHDEDDEPERVPTPRRQRTNVARWLVAAAAVLAGVVIGVQVLGPGEEEPLPGRTFELAGTEVAPEASADGRVWSTGAGEWFELYLEGLPPAGPDAYYQGWVHGDEGRVSIGTFHARDADDAVHLWSGVEVEAFPEVTVTLEEIGDDVPSGPVVLEGSVPLDADGEG